MSDRPAASPAAGVADEAPPVMVAVSGVSREFGSGHTAVHALREVSFTARRGQLVTVRGRSGSGKTSLLNIIGGLDLPTSGSVAVAGREVTGMTDRERMALRRGTVAFIFQSFGLIPMLSAAENVGIPLRITGTEPRVRDEKVATMLAVVGLSECLAVELMLTGSPVKVSVPTSAMSPGSVPCAVPAPALVMVTVTPASAFT